MATALAVRPSLTIRGRVRQLRRRLTPHRRRTTTGTVSVTLTADTTAYLENIEKLRHAMGAVSAVAHSAAYPNLRHTFDSMGASMRALSRQMAYAQERALCRGEARWYIRGGLGPLLTPVVDRAEERDAQVQAMLTAGLPPRWVAAYLRGWCDTFGTDDRDPYVLHALWNGHAHRSMIEVSA